MNKSNLLFSVFLIVLLTACGNKETETINNNLPVVFEERMAVPEIVDTTPQPVLTSPYPEEIHGVWGNVFYLKNLREYNSISKALELIKFDTDIKIGKNRILSMRPQDGEPAEFDTIRYSLLRAGIDSLYVRRNNTGDQQLYMKLMNLPDTISVDLYDDETYSAISHMEWIWFNGTYDLIKKNGYKQEVTFLKTGSVAGIEYDFYTFGVDVDGKEYLYMSRDNHGHEMFFLIEYQQDGSFDCYNIEEIEDWEYPFVKSSLAFKLVKRK